MTKIVFFGDPDVKSDGDQIYAAGLKEQNVDLYVNLGDNGYSGADPVKLLVKHFPKNSEQYKKLILVLGNHDDGESESDSTEEKCGAYLPEQYKSKPEFDSTDQSWQNTRWLTSRHVGDIYFIGMNSQDMDIEFKRNQYNWVIKELETAKSLKQQGKVTWIINASHKPWFTLKSSHSPYTAVREIYSKAFQDAGVNQNWHGHNHNDQAWWSMIAINQSGNAAGEQLQSFLPDGKTIDHTKPHGWTTNINGHSGHEHNAFKENATANKNVQWANDKTFSYAVVESNPTTKILNTKWKDKAGTVLYEYNISMAGGTPTGNAPIANFTYSPLTVRDNDTVSLDATSSSDSDGNIVSYKWTLSDQLVVDKPNESRATFNIGTKANVSVTLTVTDNNGLTGTKTITIQKAPSEGCPSGQCKDPVTQQCRPIGPNETIENGFCKTIPPVGCPTGQCKDPNTLQCRFPTADETIENGFCKKKVVTPPPAGKLTPISVAASGQDLGKEASKAIDGDFESRWSCNGDGAWIEFKFDKSYPITKVKLTGYHYDKTYFFEINGKKFENPAGRPINSLVEYDLTDLKINSDTIRIIGHGNNLTTYNSFREIEFYTGTDPRHCPPNWHYDETLKKCIPDLEPRPNTGSNKVPIANAGQDQTVAPKTTVTLNGLASSDQDGTITSYSWSQISGPTVSINNSNSAVATFIAPEIGTNPNGPVAQFTYSPTNPTDNQQVTLNSINSTGTNITRKWSITDQLVISNPTGVITTFNIGTKRTVDVTLLVTDINGLTSTKTLTITNSSIPSTELDAEAEALILAKVGETILLKDNGSKGAITRHEWLKETPDAQAIQLIADSSAKFGAKFIATSDMVNKDIRFKLRVFDAQNNFNDDITGTKVSITTGTPSGGFGEDAFGMKMLFKPTGKKVAMQHGSEHENGKRYNVNHEFHNYIMQGYFKLGKGQEKINHKGDGPNHGGCSDKKICAWYELDYTLATGKGELQLENPHPTNNDVPDSSCEFVKTLAKAQEGQWIGWATAYFWGPDGKRHIRAYVDLKPFADIMAGTGKPLNNWQELVFAIEKGQIFKGITHPRNMQEVIDHEAGLESEIRMHRATQKDTKMNNVFVFEIDPKAQPLQSMIKENINWEIIPDKGNRAKKLQDEERDRELNLDCDKPKVKSVIAATSDVAAAAVSQDLIFQLRVTDNKGASSTDTVRITVSDGSTPTNQPPIANAGQDQTVGSNAIVTLNGSLSSDPDGTIVSYKWVQTGGPPVTLNNANSAIATFKAPDLFATEPAKNYKYTYSHKWGSNGTGNGQFRQLEGIAVDKDNNIYVGDWVRHDIQKFTPNGTFIRRFGGVVGQPSSKNGEFNTPFSIRFDPEDGHMWVADQFNHRLQKINRDTGAYMRQIGPTIAGANPPNLNEPEDVDFDPIDYSIYINDQHNSRIIKVDTTGKFITQWQPFDETYPDEYPEGISVNPTTRNLYVTAYFTPKVSVFSPSGKLAFDITLPEGTGPGQFTLPLERNYFHKDGTFYQLNGNSKPKVYVFNTAGTLLTEFGTGPGSGNGQLDDAEQVAVDSNHNVYVIDQNNYRISVFKAEEI